jgi:hypothetical protein
MGVRTRHITNNSSHKRFQTLYAYPRILVALATPDIVHRRYANSSAALSSSTEHLCFSYSVTHRTDAVRAPGHDGLPSSLCADSSDEGHDMLMTPP